MKRVRIVEFAALSLGIGLTPTLARAQSVDVPLNFALNTGYNYGAAPTTSNPVLTLTINVGVNGAAAQAYAFDTGSAEFLTPNGVFGNAPSQSGLSAVETYTGNTFGGSVYQISASSLKFYAAAGATSGGISLSTSGNYNVASYTSLNNGALPAQPFGTAVVGVFGSEPQAFNVAGTSPQVSMGGIFGQTILPNTTAGWVVSANGQSLSALNAQLGTSIPGGPAGNGQQSAQTVPQSVTNCNPCVTVGLTPALLAQFLPFNIAQSHAVTPLFPNSNAQAFDKFVPLNFTLSSPLTSLPAQKVSIDSGFVDFHLDIAPNYATHFPNPVLTVDANSDGTQTTFDAINPNFTSVAANAPIVYDLRNTNDPTTNFLGLGFFLANSVLYNLAGLAEGYSPNFVTDANVTTTQSSPLTIGSNSVPLGLAGVISGPGGVFITSGGSATLSGTNTYSGPTSVSGGFLALVGPGSIATSSGVDVSAGGMFDISGVNGGTSIMSLSGNGNVALGGNALTLYNASGTFSGVIADGGLVGGSGGMLVLSGGTETLSGDNTYTGPTSVNAGVLDVTGSIASSSLTTVANGAALIGTGTIGNLQIASGGMFAPGNGTAGSAMTVAGNLAFQAGALYLVQVNPTTASFSSVSGNASLNGSVAAAFANGNFISKVYTILTAGSVSGKFASISSANLPANFTASLAYDTAHAYLDLTLQFGTLPNPLKAPAFTPLNTNEGSVADTLVNYFNTNGGIPMKFGTLTSSGLAQVGGEDATGAQRGAFELTNEFLGLMLDPFVYGRGGAASGGGPLGFAPDQDTSLPNDVALAYAGILKAPPKPAVALDQRWTVWGTSFGGSGTANGDTAIGSNNVTTSAFGFAAGADYHVVPDTVLGFALAGSGTNWNLAQALGTGRSDAFQAGVYGTKYFGPAYVGAALAFTNNWFTTSRTALGDQLTARFQGQSFGARVESGYRYALAAAAGVTPYAAIQAQNFHTPAYTETDLTGGGFGLSYNAMNATDTRSELGARFDALTAWGATPVQLRARLAWAHDWVNNPALGASFQALPGTSFVVNGAPVPHDSALTSIGAELHLTQRWTLLGKFDGEFASSSQIYAGSGTLRYAW